MPDGKLIVVSGLSATGKTTIVRALSRFLGVPALPEHNDWIGGSRNFPRAPVTRDEKKAKQHFFLEIDRERYRLARDLLRREELVLCDSDFTAPLAHNYAERWARPDLDVYDWLVQLYGDSIDRREVGPAHAYLYLDASLDRRRERRAADVDRSRNGAFFQAPFADGMRRFYHAMMHPDSPRRALNAAWFPYEGGQEEALPILANLLESLTTPVRPTDLDRLKSSLRSTVKDVDLWANSSSGSAS
jgi:deoxyadenosine/deoxycytidine kinase